jgi:hypothetical protein
MVGGQSPDDLLESERWDAEKASHKEAQDEHGKDDERNGDDGTELEEK